LVLSLFRDKTPRTSEKARAPDKVESLAALAQIALLEEKLPSRSHHSNRMEDPNVSVYSKKSAHRESSKERDDKSGSVAELRESRRHTSSSRSHR
jgi:hypothetical protein